MSHDIELLIGEVDKINQEIFAINQTVAPKIAALNAKKSTAQEMLDRKINEQAGKILASKDYGCGTATIETDNFKIKTVVSKKIKWDESMLHNIEGVITAGGKNPRDFIKQKLSVSETAYKTFPVDIQKVFEPARTVEPSAPKTTYERKV